MNFVKKIISRTLYFFFRRLTLSYSQVSMYMRCPLQYKLAYKLFIKTDQTPAMSYGSAIHDVLETYHKMRTKIKEGDLELLYRIMDELWVREGFANQPPEVTEQFKEKGRKLLKAYYDSHLGYEGEPIFLEQWLNINVGPHKVNGIIDRIEFYPDGSYALADYKTHFDKSTKEPIAQDLQMSLYQIACVEDTDLARNIFYERRNRLKKKLKKDVKTGSLPKSEYRKAYRKGIDDNEEPVKLIHHFLSFNEKETSGKRLPEQLVQAKKLVMEVAAKILKKEFGPNVGLHCKTLCSYGKLQICPVFKGKNMDDIIKQAVPETQKYGVASEESYRTVEVE